MQALLTCFPGTVTATVALLLCAAGSASYAESIAPASPHPVVAQLVDEGLALGPGGGDAVVRLTPPVMRVEMSAEEQHAAFAELVGEGRMERYLADKVVTPQVLRITTEKDLEGGGAIRRLDQHFVVYGDLKLIREKDLLNDFMAKEKAEQEPGKFDQYLEQLDEPSAAGEPYLYRYRMPLLDKVMISGLIRGQTFTADGLLIESAVSAEDLLTDARNPTVWQSIPRRAASDDALGSSIPYRGLAGYLQVTELQFQPGALLVECHGVLVEPRGWFGGRNLLASKLPIVAQDNMRSFRRKLSRAMAEYREQQAAQD